MAPEADRPLKIGIVCNPTIGGSGALATELGIWLAARGHELHFISYDLPFRLREHYNSNVFFHTVTLQHYDLFKYPPYTIALAAKIAEVVPSGEFPPLVGFAVGAMPCRPKSATSLASA